MLYGEYFEWKRFTIKLACRSGVAKGVTVF